MAWTCWSRAVALASSAASLVVVWATNLSALSRAVQTLVSTRPVWRLMKGPARFWPLGLVGGGSMPLNPPAAPPGVPLSGSMSLSGGVLAVLVEAE